MRFPRLSICWSFKDCRKAEVVSVCSKIKGAGAAPSWGVESLCSTFNGVGGILISIVVIADVVRADN